MAAAGSSVVFPIPSFHVAVVHVGHAPLAAVDGKCRQSQLEVAQRR